MLKLAYLPSSALAKALLIGGGIGIGARGVKHVSDMMQNRDIKPPVDLPRTPSSSVPLQVGVSREEAAELEAQGVKVRRIGRNLKQKLANDFVNNLAMGAVGAGAAYGGWKLLDKPLDDDRRSLAKAKLMAARKRVESLLSDQPQHPDLALHGYMKGAEEAYFAKEAGIVTDGIGSMLELLSPIAVPLGVAGVALGASSFNEARARNKNEQAVKALKGFYRQRNTRPSQAELEPVLYEDEAPIGQDLGRKVAAALEAKKSLGKKLSAGVPFAKALKGDKADVSGGLPVAAG